VTVPVRPKRRTPSTLAGRLKLARKVRGLSARKTSELAGLSSNHVTMLERRKNEHIWQKTVEALATVLQVDSAWLYFGTGDPPVAAATPAAAPPATTPPRRKPAVPKTQTRERVARRP